MAKATDQGEPLGSHQSEPPSTPKADLLIDRHTVDLVAGAKQVHLKLGGSTPTGSRASTAMALLIASVPGLGAAAGVAVIGLMTGAPWPVSFPAAIVLGIAVMVTYIVQSRHSADRRMPVTIINRDTGEPEGEVTVVVDRRKAIDGGVARTKRRTRKKRKR